MATFSRGFSTNKAGDDSSSRGIYGECGDNYTRIAEIRSSARRARLFWYFRSIATYPLNIEVLLCPGGQRVAVQVVAADQTRSATKTGGAKDTIRLKKEFLRLSA